MDDTLTPPVTTDPAMTGSSQVCTKCNKGTLKRSNFRTGSVDKPKATVAVCTKCGHRVELDTK